MKRLIEIEIPDSSLLTLAEAKLLEIGCTVVCIRVPGEADHHYQPSWEPGHGFPEICGLCPLPKVAHPQELRP